MCDVTLRCIGSIIVAGEKQLAWLTVCVCVCFCRLRYPPCNALAPYCHLWPACLYIVFPHYLISGKIFNKCYWTKKCMFWYFSIAFVHSISHSKNNCVRYDKKLSWLHTKFLLFLPDFNETWISLTEIQTTLKYQNSWKFVQWEPSLYGWTGSNDKVKSCFLQFC
jgi:hypothetical protein